MSTLDEYRAELVGEVKDHKWFEDMLEGKDESAADTNAYSGALRKAHMALEREPKKMRRDNTLRIARENVPSVALPTGQRMPVIAFGTGTAWFEQAPAAAAMGRPTGALTKVLLEALRVGYRHIDCAEMYGTEPHVGAALTAWQEETGAISSRSDLFITSKVWQGALEGKVEAACRASIKNIGCKYLDMYLLHAPLRFSPDARAGADGEADTIAVWRAMERLVEQGLVRHIGVSNHGVEDLQRLLKVAKIKPAVNQVEHNPYCQLPKLQRLCKEEGIAMQAYTPLAPVVHKPGCAADMILGLAAEAHHINTAQVLYRWNVQKGFAFVTTTAKPARMEAAMLCFAPGCELTAIEMAAIDTEGSTLRFRKYWAEEFGDCYNTLAASVGVGPAALAMV